MINRILFPLPSQIIFRSQFSTLMNKEILFQDILILNKAKESNSQNEYYSFYFKSQKLKFANNITVMQFESEIQKQIPNVFSVSSCIYDRSSQIQFAGTTPLYLMVQKDFHLKINNDQTYIILTGVDNPPVIDLHNQYSIMQHPLQEYFQHIDQPKRQSIVLQKFIQRIVTEINKNNMKTLDRQYISMVVKKIILKDGLQAKDSKLFIDQQIAFLKLKLAKLENIKKDIISGLEREEQKQLHLIYLYIIAQIAFTQYGTYFVWGWDVMEPVTFMLGVFDMIIAYIFWMRTNLSFQFDNVLNQAVSQRLQGKFQEHFNYNEELQDVKKMIEYLKFREMLYSTKVDDVLDLIEGSIDGKETKQQKDNE